jgi:hypothetical protein
MPAMKRPARKPKWCRARPATREPTTNARQLATCSRQQQPCRYYHHYMCYQQVQWRGHPQA